ncbi:4-hydroxyphenylpyruvate dioxygenase [Klebsiella pneumoniae]|nr:4-hydroxyphenylpyruvate dioxygenase [Klebsiella pneumoniae]
MSSYSPNPTAAAQPAVTVRRSRPRIGILALLAIGTMINYLDRTVLGIAAPKLTAELGIDPAIMGILFSAFAWTYALAQIPGGLFLDRFGNKVTYFLSLTPVVAVYPVPRHGGGTEDAAAVPLRARH